MAGFMNSCMQRAARHAAWPAVDCPTNDDDGPPQWSAEIVENMVEQLGYMARVDANRSISAAVGALAASNGVLHVTHSSWGGGAGESTTTTGVSALACGGVLAADATLLSMPKGSEYEDSPDAAEGGDSGNGFPPRPNKQTDADVGDNDSMFAPNDSKSKLMPDSGMEGMDPNDRSD
jgi:hypothetical protein